MKSAVLLFTCKMEEMHDDADGGAGTFGRAGELEV